MEQAGLDPAHVTALILFVMSCTVIAVMALLAVLEFAARLQMSWRNRRSRRPMIWRSMR